MAAERLRHFADDGASRVIVAEVDGELAGLVATHIVPRLEEDEPSCRVIALVVAERHRRAGIATALLDAAEGEARAHRSRRLDLSSGDWRDDAHAFYESAGFVRGAHAFMKRLN